MTENSPTASFYVTGGTIPRDAPSYVTRNADASLLTSLLAGDFCYVLNTRQMGKSSLSVRTLAALQERGVKTAFLDLTRFGGQNVTAEQWYLGLLAETGRALGLRSEFLAYWKAHTEFSFVQRFFGALGEVALEKLTEPIVIFVDEIDAALSLTFPVDEFFGALRESFNRRTQDERFQRLTFCLLGVATPADLISDTRMSPFNIGKRITLTDFTASEAAPLASHLAGGKPVLDRVLHWTGGHPYLTQRLCRAIAEEPHEVKPADVDRLCDALFLSKSARDSDDNLSFVRNRLLRSDVDLASLLDLYGKVRSGKRVSDDETNPLVPVLRLSGVARVDTNGNLIVRNRIYDHVFDKQWVVTHMPDAELQRQRDAAARARWQVGSIAAVVLLGMGLLSAWALDNAKRADVERTKALASAKAESQAKTDADTQRVKAEQQATLALAAKNQALTARNQAIASNNIAQAATAKAQAALKGESSAKAVAQENALQAQQSALVAQSEKQRAQAQTQLAVTSANKANHIAYIFSTNLTDQALNNNNYLSASLNFTEMSRSAKSEQGFEYVYLKERLYPEIHRFSHTESVTLATFSPNGKTIATACVDRMVRLWDVNTGHEIRKFKGHSNEIYAVAFSPNGKTVATGSDDKTLRTWDVETGKQVLIMRGHTDYINQLIFSHDGKKIATASQDKTARIWDAKTGKEILQIKENSHSINSVVFSPDDKQIVMGSDDKTVRIWDTIHGRELSQFTGHSQGVLSVTFSPDGLKLATASRDRTARIWDVVSRKELLQLSGHSNDVISVAFSPDGQKLATGSRDGTARVWDALTGKELVQFKGHLYIVGSVAFSPDGQKLLTTGSDNTARIWEVATNREIVTFKGHSASITSLAVSHDGKKIFTGSFDKTARLWDIATSQERLIFQGHTSWIRSVAFSPDDTKVATSSGNTLPTNGFYTSSIATNDDKVRIWSVATGKELLQLNGHSSSVMSVAFSPRGKQIATASMDKTAKIWDATTGQELLTLKGHSSFVFSLAFSPDGKKIATVSDDKTVCIWDVATGKKLLQRKVHLAAVFAVSFSPNGKTIATGGTDNIVGLWDAITGKEILQLKGHSGPIQSVAFSPDGTRIVTGSSDGTTRIWDVVTGREMLALKRDQIGVFSVAFSPDGKQVFSGGGTTVRLWRRINDSQIQEVKRQEAEVRQQEIFKEALNQLSTPPLTSLLTEMQRLQEKPLTPLQKLQIASILNNAAWATVDPAKPTSTPAQIRLVLPIAEKAVELDGGKNVSSLDTLAAVRFANGDLAGALEVQRQAVEFLSPNAVKALADDIKANLARYEKLWAERSRGQK